METKFIVLKSLDDNLVLSLFNHHAHRKHNLLGASRYQLSKLREVTSEGGLVLPLFKRNKVRGELLVDVIFYPILQGNGDCDDFCK